ncbi:BTB/POZ domain-containing protein KCTD21 [Holothuria leucospilota]|uniref:BTB/POZ domain-containing protein KCTD21 n=1 Tax=Holothuria leucospilota TaxID=206669 RepID=A0A9Q1C9P2_HOLLE|nr:BTB/POZ domain-containing protein KCTD21 [Holothuria leucospilota]
MSFLAHERLETGVAAQKFCHCKEKSRLAARVRLGAQPALKHEDIPYGPFSQVITINVGGNKYTISTRSLFEYKDSKLYKLCLDKTHRHGKDHEGNVFINRDGELFKYVLRYMQQGQLVLPKGFTDADALAVEADYYGVKKLTEELEQYKKKQRAILWVRLDCKREKHFKEIQTGFPRSNVSVAIPYFIHYCCTLETYQNLPFLKEFQDTYTGGGSIHIDGHRTTFENLQSEGPGKWVDIFHVLKNFKFFETLANEGFEQKESWVDFRMYKCS